jgi:hypothetical protein
MNPLHHTPRHFLSRRDWLVRTGSGFSGLALAAQLAEEAEAAAPPTPAISRGPHLAARAKRVLHVFLEGGPSHVDTFDPKPKLKEQDGKLITVPGGEKPRKAFGSPFAFRKCGNSGIEISTVFRELGKQADELCVMRSMHTSDPGHEQAMLMMNCGNTRFARPAVGAWTTYGLGTENRNLPGFIIATSRS